MKLFRRVNINPVLGAQLELPGETLIIFFDQKHPGEISDLSPGHLDRVYLHSKQKLESFSAHLKGLGTNFLWDKHPDLLTDLACFARHPISSWDPQAKHCIWSLIQDQ